MSLFTVIARVNNPLMLAESMDSGSSEMNQLREQAKDLLKKIDLKSPDRMAIENGPYYYLYIMKNDVCYLTLCEKAYPKKLAYTFLEELQKEFESSHGPEVQNAKRPYNFIQFDTFIQKTKKLYNDTRASRNVTVVQQELSQVTKIMTKNIKDILGRGEQISIVADMSDQLFEETKTFEKNAIALKNKMFWKTYGPIFVAIGVVFFFLILRFYWWR